ncbi:hypothetical protein ACYOEI_08525 [Singulisphaera rosea]
MHFDIQPYSGAHPVKFGMSRDAVYKILGTPESSMSTWEDRGIAEHYNEARIIMCYMNDLFVNHVGFAPGGAEISIHNRPIWTINSHPDPNLILLALDPNPVEFVGLWFFLALGVTSTGYHEDDPSQCAVTVFPRDEHDELLEDAKPADTRKYRQNRQI